VVEAARTSVAVPLVYAVAPSPGISQARQTAVGAAGDVGAIAFIDDDERPVDGWLDELVACRARTGAAIVFGPVEPAYEEPPPDWVVRGRFFDAHSFPDDAAMNFAYSGNALVLAELLHRYGFDDRYGLSGGEDTHLFMRAHLDGHRIVWCSAARVRESVPPERTTAKWLVSREFRRGNTLSLCLLDLEDSPRRRLKRVAHGGLRIALGAARLVLLGPRGKHARVAALREMAFGAGLIVGLSGRRYSPYRLAGPR
jgi:hypothetical protein